MVKRQKRNPFLPKKKEPNPKGVRGLSSLPQRGFPFTIPLTRKKKESTLYLFGVEVKRVFFFDKEESFFLVKRVKRVW